MNTDAQVSALATQKYGVELTRMGFVDYAANEYVRGICAGGSPVRTSFIGRWETSRPLDYKWPASADHSSVPCLAMRLREGRLTVGLPPEPGGVSEAAGQERAMHAVD